MVMVMVMVLLWLWLYFAQLPSCPFARNHKAASDLLSQVSLLLSPIDRNSIESATNDLAKAAFCVVKCYYLFVIIDWTKSKRERKYPLLGLKSLRLLPKVKVKVFEEKN